MANMIPISTVTVGSGGASSIDFNSIPQTYTDLVMKLSLRSTRTAFAQDDLYYKYNGSSTSNSGIQIRASGSAVISTSGWITYNYGGQVDSNSATSNTFSNIDIYIPNYSGSNNKSSSVDGIEENNATEAYANLLANLWSNTSPITSIALTLGAGNFVQYSSATLYGIRKY